MKLAPIALFTYSRPQHTMLTLNALRNNRLAPESDLWVFSDGCKGENDKECVDEVRKTVRSADGFKTLTLIENESNNGLANNIIQGVTQLLNDRGKIIVVEDDLLTSPHFLSFMNRGLDFFADEEKVGHLHGYSYPIPQLPEAFFTKWIGSWGWATWKRAWQHFNPDGQALMNELKRRKLTRNFDFGGTYPYTRMLQRQIDGQNNSWAIRWFASAYLQGMLSLNAGQSLVQNIGFDNSGTHCDDNDIYNTTPCDRELSIDLPKIEEDLTARKLIENFHGETFSLSAKIKRRLNLYLHKR
ncbi:MAG: glycosyltransferase family 2 protein [Dysgonamonadaceae bacterium]|jgi:hypothetical protein|nr:glycosyltransferase family 2 protein [Dysgonamonadaceae bacterium]